MQKLNRINWEEFNLVDIRKIIILIILLILDFYVLKKLEFKGKKLVFIVVNMVLIFLISFPFSTLKIFKSPEEAFKYMYPNEEPRVTLKGKESAFLTLDKNGRIEPSLYRKNSNGWKIEQNLNGKIIKDIKKYVIVVYHLNNTKDYFISVNSHNFDKLNISDNFDTEFICKKECVEKQDGEFCIHNYYAYIYDLNDNYQLTIDDENIDLVLN